MNRIYANAGGLIYLSISFFINIILSLAFHSMSIFLIGAFGAFLTTYLINKTDSRTAYVTPVIKGIYYIFILLVYFGNIEVYDEPYYNGGSDDLFFEVRAKDYWIVNDIYFPCQDKWPSNIKGFLWIISSIIRFSDLFDGYHTVCFRVLNTDILLASGCIVYLICVKHLGFNTYRSRVAMLAFCLFPNAIMISSYVFRDTIAVFLLISSYYKIENIFAHLHIINGGIVYDRLKGKDICELIILAFSAYWIRREVLFYILVIILLSVIGKGKITIKTFFRYMVPILLLLIFFGVTGVLENVQSKVLDYSVYLASDAASGGKGALSNLVFNRDILPYGWIFRTIYALVSPIPVGIFRILNGLNGVTVTDFLIGLGTCFQVIMLPFLAGEVKGRDKLMWTYLFIFFTIILTTFGFRHFILLYPFQSMLVARDFFNSNTLNRRSKIHFGVLVLLSFAICYFVLKILI